MDKKMDFIKDYIKPSSFNSSYMPSIKNKSVEDARAKLNQALIKNKIENIKFNGAMKILNSFKF